MDAQTHLTDEAFAAMGRIDCRALAKALEASWDHRTAYQGIIHLGNPASGQCYPTARVVQYFFPDFEIAVGEVWTGSGIERHFWNIRSQGESVEWMDLSWQQFPPGSVVRKFEILGQDASSDSPGTQDRCALLLRRVLTHLQQDPAARLNPVCVGSMSGRLSSDRQAAGARPPLRAARRT